MLMLFVLVMMSMFVFMFVVLAMMSMFVMVLSFIVLPMLFMFYVFFMGFDVLRRSISAGLCLAFISMNGLNSF